MKSKNGRYFIKCNMSHFDAVVSLYDRSVKKLEETVNYPKWSKDHPSREYIKDSIKNGRQFACLKDGEVLGAIVLSENPEGNYRAGEWSRELEEGEYLAIHVLAVDPEYKRQGIGGFLVDKSIEFARKNGYKAIRLDVVPENLPAVSLYKSKGFTSAGKKDLMRNIENIPVFELYGLNL